MVNIIDKTGKVKSTTNSVAGLRQAEIIRLTTENTKQFLQGKTNNLLTLQEIKNILKKDPNNKFGMYMQKGHANAHVRYDCLHLRVGNVLEAKEFGSRVVFFNLGAVKELVSGTKDKKILADIDARLKILRELPKRKSYYE